MQIYEAPLRDMRFVLHELFDGDEFGDLPGQDELSAELLDAVLEEAARLTRDVLLPVNASGDVEGCRIEDRGVVTPMGFRDAYEQFRAGGWCALAGDPAYGGQGLPERLNKLVEEMICATNVSFSLYPGLTHGATVAIAEHATEELKRAYLPNMIEGRWAGTMCLTEAQCGTDLGLIRTRAVARDDGGFLVTGSKIFISAGDHDLTENIIHLVLARLPDAPAGIKGISLFLVPKLLPPAEGAPLSANGVAVSGIEHKMGLRASATCQIEFDGSVGWLVGTPNKGMSAMFAMMNSERVSVGVQGLGLTEISYQNAVAYASERLQGRAPGGTVRPDLLADPIISHPDVRRMLMTMRAYAEGNRALCGWIARALDAERLSDDPLVREKAADLTALMTPVVKALFTDLGFEATSLGVQIYGGHGYIREHGMEQHVRDSRIGMLYEGTNGIQALDLAARKLFADGGRYTDQLFEPISRLLLDEATTEDDRLRAMLQVLREASSDLREATTFIRTKDDREETAAAATDYLRLMGLVAMGYCLALSARIGVAKEASGDDFYRIKIQTAAFFFDRILPNSAALLSAITSGKSSTMALLASDF